MNDSFLILIVDDEAFVADVLNRAASNAFPEARFVHVADFLAASQYLEGLRGRGPRLVLLDIDLHGVHDGFDFLRLLRTHPQGRLVPVVILSTNNGSTRVRTAYDQGANVFTTKPYSYEDWKQYVVSLRDYWYQTVQVPQLRFTSDTNLP